MISIVACCHGAKLCAHAAQYFRSQQLILFHRREFEPGVAHGVRFSCGTEGLGTVFNLCMCPANLGHAPLQRIDHYSHVITNRHRYSQTYSKFFQRSLFVNFVVAEFSITCNSSIGLHIVDCVFDS